MDHSESNTEFTVNVVITNKAQNNTRRFDDYHDVATPPPYESVRYKPTSTEKTKNSTRKEWDAVAARIATRTSSARNAARRLSNNYNSARIEKISTRRHKPAGLSIDTSVARPRGLPKQVFPREPRKQQAGSYTKLVDDGTRLAATRLQRNVESQAQPVSKFSPETPTILITPALASRASPEQRARVASSIYSRLTSGATPPHPGR